MKFWSISSKVIDRGLQDNDTEESALSGEVFTISPVESSLSSYKCFNIVYTVQF